jgi:phage tail protein X
LVREKKKKFYTQIQGVTSIVYSANNVLGDYMSKLLKTVLGPVCFSL